MPGIGWGGLRLGRVLSRRGRLRGGGTGGIVTGGVWMTGRSISGAFASELTRKGRRSSSLRSSTRMMCGVSVSTTSVWSSLSVLREQPADNRHVAQAGDSFHERPLVVANQAGEQVRLAVAQPDRRRDFAIAERRQPAEPGAEMAGDDHFQRQRHVVVVVRARRDVDVHADVLILKRRDRLLGDAARCDGREGRHRNGNLLAEPRLRRHAF